MGSKNWIFTLNNYTNEDVERVSNLVNNSKAEYVIFGKETASTGTPHLQGFIKFKRRVRLVPTKTIIGSNPHVQVANKVMACIQYCKKEGNWVEFGSLGKTQGSRGDLDDFKQAVKDGMLDSKEARERFPDTYAKYPRFCIEYMRDNYPKIEIEQHPLRPWQKHLDTILKGPPDRRTIIFVVDKIGNSGKSWFADWYEQNSNDTCQVLTPCRRSDMAYALLPGLRVLFMDAPRAKQSEHIQYDFLEDLKNGRVFSPKYESTMKKYTCMHVVVFMNEHPDMTKLSLDRFNIINVEDFKEEIEN
jgi:hypothetical protein